jgi:hypothetical protein
LMAMCSITRRPKFPFAAFPTMKKESEGILSLQYVGLDRR